MCTINELILIIKEYNRLTNPNYVYKSDNAIELGTFLKSSNTKCSLAFPVMHSELRNLGFSI